MLKGGKIVLMFVKGTLQIFFRRQCNVRIVLGHRARGFMRALISPLKDIVNVFLNGQLVLKEGTFIHNQGESFGSPFFVSWLLCAKGAVAKGD